MNKRGLNLALLAGIAGAGFASTAVGASTAITEDDAKAAIMTWLDALQTGDPAKVEKVLAPDFQILRSDGQGFTKKDYLTALPKQTSKPEVTKLVFTADRRFRGDALHATPRPDHQEQAGADGRAAPFGFPPFGRTWLIVAHANFARIG